MVFHQNVSGLSPDCVALHPRRQNNQDCHCNAIINLFRLLLFSYFLFLLHIFPPFLNLILLYIVSFILFLVVLISVHHLLTFCLIFFISVFLLHFLLILFLISVSSNTISHLLLLLLFPLLLVLRRHLIWGNKFFFPQGYAAIKFKPLRLLF